MSLFKKYWTATVAVCAVFLALLYWGLIASDRYVSEAHIIIQHTDLNSGQTMDIGSLLGNSNTADHGDQLLLRDYLLSVDMLKKLDARLHLRAHYSDEQHDILSRLWAENEPLEWFYEYYLSRVSVEFDDYAGVLVIKAQGYDAKTAQAIASLLVEEGEYFMNAAAQSLAQEQVSFLKREAESMTERVMQARQAVITFQNKQGMVSPENTAENVSGIINHMEEQLSGLKTSRDAMLGYLMPDSSNVIELNLKIASIQKQLAVEKARLASPTGKTTLNRTIEEFQRLQMNAEFAQDIYKTALVALEQGRIEASRTLRKVSVLQSPTEPQYPLEPRRLYNSIVSIVLILLIVGITHLFTAIIRDHKD